MNNSSLMKSGGFDIPHRNQVTVAGPAWRRWRRSPVTFHLHPAARGPLLPPDQADPQAQGWGSNPSPVLSSVFAGLSASPRSRGTHSLPCCWRVRNHAEPLRSWLSP